MPKIFERSLSWAAILALGSGAIVLVPSLAALLAAIAASYLAVM